MLFIKKKFSVLIVLLVVSVAANGLNLQQAKKQGLLGERITGYVGVVADNAEAKTIAATINAKRKQHYQGIAKKNGTTLEAVEKLAGKKAIEKTPAGQKVDTGSGWVSK